MLRLAVPLRYPMGSALDRIGIVHLVESIGGLYHGFPRIEPAASEQAIR